MARRAVSGRSRRTAQLTATSVRPDQRALAAAQVEVDDDAAAVSLDLIGSQRPLKRLTHEIDSLSRYVDQRSQEKLAVIRGLAIEKDRLDFARVHLGLAKGWLFVHVPITYALIVLTLLHILVVYAFSSGAW